MDSQTALLLATVGLVVATAVLAWFTWGLWSETKASRQPLLIASIDFFPPDHGEIRFVNAGAGSAVSVDVTFAAEGGEARRLNPPAILPGDGLNYHLLSTLDKEAKPEIKGLGQTVEAFPTMVVDGTYQDVRGHSYDLRQRLDISELWEEAKRGRRLAAFRGPLLPFYTLVESLRDEVRRLAN
jgi:hypothetical protein